MTGGSEAVSVCLLADRPQLIDAVSRIRWRQWGYAPEPEDLSWWVEVTTREAARDGLPVTFVAVDARGEALGAVGLGEFDLEERRDRSPWLLGMVVRPDWRRRGVGRILMSRLESFAAAAGYRQLWVATGPASGFYERCGWRQTERFQPISGDLVTVLTKPMPSHLPMIMDEDRG